MTMLQRARQAFWRRILGAGAFEEYVVTLGEEPQETMLHAAVDVSELWNNESIRTKLMSLIRRRWRPSADAVMQAATQVFCQGVFGEEEDFGNILFELMLAHSNEPWDFSFLTPEDLSRAHAISAFTIATRNRLRSSIGSDPPLNLRLAEKAPLICSLAIPMVIKVPVVSLRWFLEIHVHYAFNEIRRSGHPNADELISYLYELLFLQQKIAIGLNEFLRLAAYTGKNKGQAYLINAEVDAMMSADLIFSYLKASIEKTLVLVAVAHGIANLDAKKTHKAKLETLGRDMPADVKETGYYQFILEFVKSENLDELNSYRSGLLHKRGIADLQPHNYVSIDPLMLPFRKIYAVLHEQHSKNTAVLLAALALLTDELVRRSSALEVDAEPPAAS